MSFESVLGKLGARQQRSGWIAHCPAHDDRNASLSIAKRNGKLLVYCHAGCRIDDVLAMAGIEKAELFENYSPTLKTEAATYDYVDEQGNLLFQVVRFEPKSFRQRRPDGNGGWAWNLTGIRRVLYRLPEVLAANGVIVCEGEKDAEAAKALGFTATCNCGGAGKWRDEYSEFLRGKRIGIIADADEAGRKHALAVAASLHGVAKYVKVVELPDAKDLAEWVERGGTREQLKAIFNSAPKWNPERPPAIGRLAAEVDATPISWLWPGYLPAGKLILLDGDPSVGKSTLAIELAAIISSGRNFPGSSDAAEPGGVVILTAEDDLADTVVPRLMAAAADRSRIRVVPVMTQDGQVISIPDFIPQLKAAIESVEARLLVIDPINAFLGREVDSHKDKDVRGALGPLSQLANETGAACLIIRHLNKAVGMSPLHRGGGSIAYIAACRAAFLAAEDPENPGQKRYVLACTKANLAAKPSSLVYQIEGIIVEQLRAADPAFQTISYPTIAWHGTSELKAADLVANSADSSLFTEAAEFLREELSGGPRKSSELWRAAKREGIKARTLKRAKRQLGVKAKQISKNIWTWELPEKNHSQPEDNR